MRYPRWTGATALIAVCFTTVITAEKHTHLHHRFHRRADCLTTQVVSRDSCASLASRCEISGAEFTEYNPSPTLCSTLVPGQQVCCSSGTLPDLTPKPNEDGSCASYIVVSGDSCSAIAASRSLTADNLEIFNQNTWGWTGCANLQAGINMCVSQGTPPMPAPVPDAVCGPQVPGTQRPAAEVDLSTLNPCPLNACCSVWGQCGTTEEHCVPSGTGPPGTARPGTNGCISNCGTDIVNNGSAPSEFISVGYFQSYNSDRPCLRMDVTQVDKTKYTHIHFAFANLTQDFQVNVSSVQDPFMKFTQMSGIKKILVLGGWAFSSAPDTYMIFRNGVRPENRDTLATNVADFILRWGLDGVDIDWEYPGAPDIPGIPPGGPSEGTDFESFLRILRTKLPNKSLSIAAPASYWYLKSFPIQGIGSVVDYVIFMTYDFHGQWDYGSQWSTTGCPKGDCMRSHVNMTETHNALSMITKAGVPTNKIVVGITSYGRSFQMTTPGCTGPMCTFTGPGSGATPGPCTETAGVLANAEIDYIIATHSDVQQFTDESDSSILVYNSDQWVSYMDDTVKAGRISKYKSWNFQGSSDWAVDLQCHAPNLESIFSFNNPITNGTIQPRRSGCSGSFASCQHRWVH